MPTNETTSIQTNCSECARTIETEVETQALNFFMMRADTVQQLFPRHSGEQREAIMGYRNGWFLCPKCWDEQIGPDEKDDNGYHDTTR
jgi:predicted RNA-binding Zn-ribbon protein involved in translation (DUF1610 family)